MKNGIGPMTRAIPRLRIPILVVTILLGSFPCALAQDDSVETYSPAAVTTSDIFKIRGEIGTFGEAYNISGRERRRPSGTSRLYLRSTWTAWGSISGSLNLMLSNEGNAARQDINQFDFNPRWRWGSAHIGDFSEEFTPLTLSGVRVRGAAVMLAPAKWRFSLIGGRTSRAVSQTGRNRSYERTIAGGGIGIGHEGGTSIDLYIITARDDLSSLAELPIDSIPPDTSLLDTATADFEQAPITVTPQENLVAAMKINLAFFQRKLTWRHEFGASAITRDRRSLELDDADVPEFLTNLFAPRKSSSADLAYTSDLALNLQRLSIRTGFHYVGPGYTSLGVTSLMPDRQEITAGLSYRLRRGLVRVDGALQRDNLIDQKRFTTDRLRLNSLVSYRLRPSWNLTAGITYIGMSNHALSDTTRIDYGSWIMRTGQQFMFRRQQGIRSIALDLLYQHAADQNPLRQSAAVDCKSATITAITGINSSLEMNTSVGLISSQAGASGRTLTQNYSLSLRHVALQRRLVSTAALSVAVGDINTSLRPRIRSGYDLGHSLTVAAEVEVTSVKGGAETAQFDEVAVRLTFVRRF